jgi:hypothetical protein
LQDANVGDFPGIVTLLNTQTNQRINIIPGSYPQTLYLNSPGTFNASLFYNSLGSGPSQLVVRDNIVASGITTVTTSRNEAKNQIIINGTKADGTMSVNTVMYLELTKPDYSDSFGWVYGANGGAYVSDVSTNHVIYAYASPNNAETPSIYTFGGRSNGLT